MNKKYLPLYLLLSGILSCNLNQSSETYSEWRNYAGTKDGSRYSSIDEINTANVHLLKVAWTFSTRDKDSGNRSQNQCNPIVIDNQLIGVSPRLQLFSVDAASGNPKWIFDPASVDSSAASNPYTYYKVSRGVAYWQKGKEKRIFYAAGEKLYSIDAANGKPDPLFGKGGYLLLSDSLGRKDGFDPFVVGTTPGIIYNDLIIMGSRVSESQDAAPGDIRAYDVRTGKRRWIFHTIPHPGEKGFETWPDKEAYNKLGGANSWAGLSMDEKRGIVYVPLGSVSGDFYGGSRQGQNLFGNSLVALDAATGKYLWHFQTVHHDLWDRDLSANPNLLTLQKDGKNIDAVAQITKQGFVFVFDRVSGKPVFPIEERPVPQNALPGEQPWPTQPFPTLPETFARQEFTEDMLYFANAASEVELRKKFNSVKYNQLFTPPSKEGGWIFPGFDGGGEWGGAAVDPETQIMYISSTDIPWTMHMADAPKKLVENTAFAKGHNVYNQFCIACHGADLKGNPPAFPPLDFIGNKYLPAEILEIVNDGRNMMPGFKTIPPADKQSLIDFMLSHKETGIGPQSSIQKNDNRVTSVQPFANEVPFTMTGYNRFTDENGIPGVKPPWGTLTAINLNTGKRLWQVPLGNFDSLQVPGQPPTGTQIYGGPVVTKGGLIFVAGTQDEKIRAFDKNTGKELWSAKLPAAGYATPAVYAVNGKQYLVIACGGGKLGSKSGDEYLAFALP